MTTPPRGRYTQVADYLRAAITSGDYPPGSQLPSENTLAARFELSTPTISRAMGVLAAEGLILTSHGRGSFVRIDPPIICVNANYVTTAPDGSRSQWRQEMQRLGLTPGQTILSVGTETPTPFVADRLQLPDDTATVVVRRRLLTVDGEAVQLADSYYPASFAEGTDIARHAKLRGGTIGALERLGRTLSRHEERIRSRMPTERERIDLNLHAGTTILEMSRLSLDVNEMPVEFSVCAMTGDRHEMVYTLPACGSSST